MPSILTDGRLVSLKHGHQPFRVCGIERTEDHQGQIRSPVDCER